MNRYPLWKYLMIALVLAFMALVPAIDDLQQP